MTSTQTSGTNLDPFAATRAVRPAPVRSKTYPARLCPVVPRTSTSRRCCRSSMRPSTNGNGSLTTSTSCWPVRAPWT